jgi:hypothetical protein
VCTGLYCLLVSVGAALYLGFYRRSLDLGWVYDNYVPLLTASVLFSYALSAYLYAASFARGAALARGGNTGCAVYDFFIGRQLNPRLGSLDLKEFCELYPGESGGGGDGCVMHLYLWGRDAAWYNRRGGGGGGPPPPPPRATNCAAGCTLFH